MKELNEECRPEIAIFPLVNFIIYKSRQLLFRKKKKNKKQSVIVLELNVQEACTMGVRIDVKVIRLTLDYPWS